MSDLTSTRDTWGYLQAVTFTHDGHRYVCEVDGGPVSASGPAEVCNARWVATIDGALVTGLDATPDDTPESVREQVLVHLHNAV